MEHNLLLALRPIPSTSSRAVIGTIPKNGKGEQNEPDNRFFVSLGKIIYLGDKGYLSGIVSYQFLHSKLCGTAIIPIGLNNAP
jgi:hypothetical protein